MTYGVLWTRHLVNKKIPSTKNEINLRSLPVSSNLLEVFLSMHVSIPSLWFQIYSTSAYLVVNLLAGFFLLLLELSKLNLHVDVARSIINTRPQCMRQPY